ncbi:MAG TPA: Gfo/Idh/MocA family oxidoreductase [Actinocrinis sp.]|jgi:myo-inositol 2-dehydrogenase/D-chiro-inositol 1-dehydrogenase
MTRLGLVGVGRIGSMHAGALHGLAGVDELLVADADTARAQAAAERLGAGVRSVADVDALFAARPDGVVIAAPTGSHAALITRAVDAGLPVFCEKPVASTAEETVDVLGRAEKLGARVQIGFQRRFDAGYAAAREAVMAGELGWVHTLRGTTLDPAPPPAAYIATSGGIFRDCSVHDFDAIRWVTGHEVIEVYASGSSRGEAFFAQSGDVSTAAAMLRLDDDSLALVSATRYNAAGYDVRLEVLGSRGSVSVGMDDRMPLKSSEPGVDWPPGPGYTGFAERFKDAYVRELHAFVDFASGRIGQSPCSIADALEAFYIAEACELSRRERRPVQVAQVRR